MRSRSASILVLLLLIGATASAVLLSRPPDPLPASAPPEEFSAERALSYLKLFAQKPHPIGSPEHDGVRDYLVGELMRLGVSPEVQSTTGITQKFSSAGTVQNIVFRLKGTSGESNALLLAAHYDSVPAGPGAGDDGSGVATLLETLRALKTRPPPRNDIIFLLSDGEEDGLLGASAFMAEHPWAKDVRLALNFEARGNAGVSQMFETSPENGLLIRELAAHSPRPAGSSLTYELYKYMPNDTDMTVFKKNGVAGLNFAFIGHWEAYHTPLDNAAELDPGSLQHHGSYALSLAWRFANLDLTRLRERDVIYFAVPGGILVRYPAAWVWPMALVLAFLLLAVGAWTVGNEQTTARRILLGSLIFVMWLAITGAAGFGFVRAVTWLHLHRLQEGDAVRSSLYTLSLIALLLTLWTLVYLLLRKKFSAGSLALGALLASFVLYLISAKFMPGASYVLLWPLVGSLLAVVATRADTNAERVPVFRALLLVALSLPALFVLTPLTHGLYEALGLTVAGGVMIGLIAGLAMGALIPQFEFVTVPLRWSVVLGGLAAGLALLCSAMYAVRYGPAHPKPSAMVYALDGATGKAFWASTAARPDDWTAQFVGASPKRGRLDGFVPDWMSFEFLQHDAPPLPLALPDARLEQDMSASGERTLVLKIRSPRRARSLSISVPQSEIAESWIEGRHLEPPVKSRWNPGGKWNLTYANVPAAGIELKLRVRGTGLVKLQIVDVSSGLPDVPGMTLPVRPPDSMPQHSGDETLVRRTFVF